ncbi:hypothetical protein HZH66_006269 [Vespula vulgaris]|uniref:Uncharacterized protein n=1 Tax=Vespula vulgaris TaxID=7454 RepID=A0A834N6U7_VESVU|nr:hypothetical protein HZH66_006269 [Vespula vulgaris]
MLLGEASESGSTGFDSGSFPSVLYPSFRWSSSRNWLVNRKPVEEAGDDGREMKGGVALVDSNNAITLVRNERVSSRPGAFFSSVGYVQWLICSCVLMATAVLSCRRSEFQCNNGHCVALNKVCNVVDDCGDGSDEVRQCSRE